ncbi:neuronal acetylcholine receptor subunit beta-3-like [Patella vulgata]|uniref:neuronal acetylcholine receptor subunit beta-3-like n=1 Tax=Patella vulgata TaxID=6465 RepID=UPI00217F58DA|nr:neuronal acetylcholine receptor subunit beta-3-like [Patella vulgata]
MWRYCKGTCVLIFLLFIIQCTGQRSSQFNDTDDQGKSSESELKDTTDQHTPPGSEGKTNRSQTSKGVATFQNAQQLETYLLSNYSKWLRPIRNQSEKMMVIVKFGLEGIVDVDEVGQLITYNVVFVVKWRDELLRWNPDEFGGISLVNIPVEKRWLPQLKVIDSVKGRNLFLDESHPYSVDENGIVVWTPAAVFTNLCLLDMTKFPFDEQVCEIRISPTDFLQNHLQLFIEDKFDTTKIQENGEWMIVDMMGVNNTNNHESVPSLILIKVVLCRRPAFILLNVFLPVIILSFVNVAVFAVPGDSGEKLSYVLIVLLALSLLLSDISSKLPTTSIRIPYITIYVSSEVLLSTLSVLMTVLIKHLRNSKQPVPVWLRGCVRFMESGCYNNKIDVFDKDGVIKWKDVSEAMDKIFLYFSLFLAGTMCTILMVLITLPNA